MVGQDYSTTAVGAAQRRADELDVPCRYLVAVLPTTPLADECADLVYTGKGALTWLADLTAWASEMARLLRWRPDGVAAVWDGRLPNIYSLLARRP